MQSTCKTKPGIDSAIGIAIVTMAVLIHTVRSRKKESETLGAKLVFKSKTFLE